MKNISFYQYLRDAMQKARLHDMPISGSFELTPLCNLDCRMCYVHLSDPSVKDRMLTGDQWIVLIDQAINRGMLLAMLTGGEAMTHPDFRKIYLYLMERGVAVGLKTNGILLREEMLELFKEYPPYVIDVSLYGCDGESYRAVTGHDVFELVSANIRAAIAAGLHLRLMITPSAYMLPWVDQIMEYASTLGADEVMLNPFLMEANPDTDRAIADYGLSLEENARIYQKSLEQFSQFLKSPTEEETEFLGEIPANEPHLLEHGLYCNAGRTGFAINWDGTMAPCLSFPRDIICADVKRIGFETAWQEVNRGVKAYSVPEDCRACAYNTRCHYCPVQHRHLAAQHRCVPEHCTWRRLQADIIEQFRKGQPSV